MADIQQQREQSSVAAFMREQFTEQQAIEFFESREWVDMTDRERTEIQFYHEKLCMPFDVFHKSVCAALGRDVYTHEFGLNRDGLVVELYEGGPKPTMQDLIEMISTRLPVVVMDLSGNLLGLRPPEGEQDGSDAQG